MSTTKTPDARKPLWLTAIASLAILFGIATIKEGGSVLFTEDGRIAAGHFVPFVLWFNFIAGFAYLVAGIALLRRKSCSKRLAAVIAGSTVVVFAMFGIHIFNGGEFELRTVVAMTLRSTFWILFALAVFRSKVFDSIDCRC